MEARSEEQKRAVIARQRAWHHYHRDSKVPLGIAGTSAKDFGR
jgi:hypothetical protein